MKDEVKNPARENDEQNLKNEAKKDVPKIIKDWKKCTEAIKRL